MRRDLAVLVLSLTLAAMSGFSVGRNFREVPAPPDPNQVLLRDLGHSPGPLIILSSSNAASKRPYSSLALSALLAGSRSAKALDAVLSEWAVASPRESAAWVLAHASLLPELSAGVRAVLWEYTAVDGKGGLVLVMALPRKFSNEFSLVATSLCQHGNMSLLMDFVETDAVAKSSSEYRRTALRAFADENLSAAIRWYASLPESLRDQSLSRDLGESIARCDLEGALDWSHAGQKGRSLQLDGAIVADALDYTPLGETLSLLESKIGPEYPRLLEPNLLKLTRVDPEATLSIARKLDAAGTGTRHVDQVFALWTREDPEHAQAWLNFHKQPSRKSGL